MGDCEICGSAHAVKKVVIEGVVFNVCNNCASLGKEVVEKNKIHSSAAQRHFKQKNVQEDIVDNFSEILKKSISKQGLKYEELARKINENESYLRRVVRGDTIPTIKLAKKLEKALNVKLVEEVE